LLYFGASEKSVAKCRKSNVRNQLQSHFHVTAKKPRESLVLQKQHHLAQLGALTTVESGLPPPLQNLFSVIAFFLDVPHREGRKKKKEKKRTSEAILHLDSTFLPS